MEKNSPRYQKLNLIIPVYNEGENIKKTIEEIDLKIKTPNEIYIIYDFEGDNTIPSILSLKKEKDLSRVRLIKNKYGRGALNAIKTGFDSVEDGVILVAMADLSDDLIVVDEMFRLINAGNDIVCGSRYVKGGRQVGGPLLKKFLSKMAGLSLHAFTGIPTHDVSNSFKMYTKNLLNQIEIESTGGFELGIEILVKAFARGFKIAEIPSVWKDRSAGESRFRLLQWLPGYLRWYFYALKNKHNAK